jgi:putative phosphoesterase
MIGIISDTHENIFAVREAVEVFKQRKVDLVIHCGDIISPLILQEFEGLNMKLIFGNNEGEKQGLSQLAAKLGFEEITEVKEFEYKGKKVFVCHGKNKALLQQKIQSQQYDYILTGLTHAVRDEEVGKTRIINPGTLYLGDELNTIALLDTEKDIVEIVSID